LKDSSVQLEPDYLLPDILKKTQVADVIVKPLESASE
jgi:hypothetical protein